MVFYQLICKVCFKQIQLIILFGVLWHYLIRIVINKSVILSIAYWAYVCLISLNVTFILDCLHLPFIFNTSHSHKALLISNAQFNVHVASNVVIYQELAYKQCFFVARIRVKRKLIWEIIDSRSIVETAFFKGSLVYAFNWEIMDSVFKEMIV